MVLTCRIMAFALAVVPCLMGMPYAAMAEDYGTFSVGYPAGWHMIGNVREDKGRLSAMFSNADFDGVVLDMAPVEGGLDAFQKGLEKQWRDLGQKGMRLAHKSERRLEYEGLMNLDGKGEDLPAKLITVFDPESGWMANVIMLGDPGEAERFARCIHIKNNALRFFQ